MSSVYLANKDLMKGLQSLADQFKQDKENNKEENYILKANQQEGSWAIYSGDNLLRELSGNYKIDYGNVKYKMSCINSHCKEIIEYGLVEESTPERKIRIEEKYDNLSDHFDVSLAFYDRNENPLEKYRAELSFLEPWFVVHDLIAV